MVSERELNAFMSAISGQESGGNYSARNPDSGAYGAFQIMPANWPSWSREAGLGQNAQRTQENQNKVARFKMKQYYDKFGNWQDVASAWYSGRPLSEVDPNRSQGKYPTIKGYVDSIMGKFQTNLGGDVSGRAQTSQAANGGQMSQQSSSPTSSYWSDRVGQINDQIEHYEKLRETLGNLPETSLTDPAIQQQIQAVDSEIQNLQGMRDEAVMMSQQEQQSAADLALTQSQIDVQRINADVAAGRLTLDQAIHELNKDIKRRQTALAEETARRTQGREDAAFIDEQLDQAAAWAPSEPGKSEYTAADTSGAHAQMLEGRGISGDTTIANYGPTRTVDPQRTLAEAGGGAQGGRGSAPGMGWTDEDRAGGGEQPPGQGAAPPDTGTGTTGQSGGAGQAGGGEQFQPGASFGGNAAPRGHPAGGPTFGGNTPPRGHPAGAPSFPGNTPPSGHPAMAGPGGSGGGYDIGGLINSGIQAGRDFLPSLLDTDTYNVPGVDVGGLVDTGMSAGGGLLDSVFRTGGSSGQRFSGNTPQSGHPAMRRR